MLAFNSEYDVVESTASQSEVKYFDDLAVPPVIVLHLPTSVITLTVNLSGLPHSGPM